AVTRAWRTREWGVDLSHFVPSLGWTVTFTVAATAILFAVGWQRHTWRPRLLAASDAVILLLWALGQQFPLQIVLLREAQQVTSRTTGVVIAAAMFATLHVPNPFLTSVTFAAALAWCWIYDRHPNLLPLAASHALLTIVVLSALGDAATGRLRVGITYLR